jgi:hypothetical protein
MLLQALTPGQTAAAQQQQAQLYGTGLFGEATASGIDALLGAGLGQAALACCLDCLAAVDLAVAAVLISYVNCLVFRRANNG